MSSTTTRTRTSRRGWQVAGIAATLVVIGGGMTIGPALAWGYMQELDTTTDRSAETIDRAPKAIDVQGATANVDVAAAEPDQVAVERTVEWVRSEPTIDENWSSGTFDVDLSCPGGITAWFNDVCRIDYGAQVPRQTAVNVTVTTGDITLDGGVGDSDMTTTTGSITAKAIAASTTSAQATTGSIELDYATAPDEVTAKVTTGDVSITLPDDDEAYRVVGETETGERNIQVATDPSAERVIDVTSTTGDVEVSYRK